MRTTLILILIFLGAIYSGNSQTLVGARPGNLTIYGAWEDGRDLTARSDKLAISYDRLRMIGSLPLNSIVTEHDSLARILSGILHETLSFEGIIPEGHFVFGNSLHEKFTVETEITIGDCKSSIMINFDVSNIKTNTSNTFMINCDGKISLTGDLGVTDRRGLQDEIRFLFTQNVQRKIM